MGVRAFVWQPELSGARCWNGDCGQEHPGKNKGSFQQQRGERTRAGDWCQGGQPTGGEEKRQAPASWGRCVSTVHVTLMPTGFWTPSTSRTQGQVDEANVKKLRAGGAVGKTDSHLGASWSPESSPFLGLANVFPATPPLLLPGKLLPWPSPPPAKPPSRPRAAPLPCPSLIPPAALRRGPQYTRGHSV